MNERRRRSRIALLAALAGVAGCSYSSASDGLDFEMNTCSAQQDCGEGSECQDGMCVAQSVDSTLTVALQITPVRTREGDEPTPILLPPFLVDGPMERTFVLPASVPVHGFVRNGPSPIDAEISFTPVNTTSGFAPRIVTVTASAESSPTDMDYSVQLLSGVDYRVLVRPGNAAIPPYTQPFRAEDDVELSFDFEELSQGHDRSYTIANIPEGRVLLVRALDLGTLEAVSSTASVTDGEAVLRFTAEPAELRIEIRADQSYPDSGMPGGPACNTDTPDFPVFRAAESDLPRDQDGNGLIELPNVPARIRFEGRVGRCEMAATDRVIVDSLPVTLHGDALLPGAEQSPLTATYEATTTATLDSSSGELRFCVGVLPGNYDVIATPPATMPCSLYAERRLIDAPEGNDASGALLALPPAQYLTGTLQVTDELPLSNASVEALALGRSLELQGTSAEQMAEEVASLTRYNRSRQESSLDDGTFRVPVDLGSYDVVFKPPTGSGFSWQVRYDVAIGARDHDFPTIIDMVSPVTVGGRIRYADSDDRSSLENAEIAAFAIVDDESGSGSEPRPQRALPLGKATADADGNFTLLLPPSIYSGW